MEYPIFQSITTSTTAGAIGQLKTVSPQLIKKPVKP
jgi:hypothetical protein